MADLYKLAHRIAGSRVRTAGRIEFIRDQGPVRRDIRVQGFQWTPNSLRNLAKILWAVERSHSYGIAALRLFSKMPASEFSPDGLLGGRGYIQSIKDMRSNLGKAIELQSEFSDTLHDEINASHWAVAEEPEVQEIVEDVETVKAAPEEFVQEQFQQEVPGESFNEFMNPDARPMNPVVLNPGAEEEEEGDSLPGSGPGWGADVANQPMPTQLSTVIDPSLDRIPDKGETEEHSSLPTDKSPQKEGKTTPEMVMRTVTPESGNYAAAIQRIVKRASSSIPVETLPGPRVEHIGPGECPEEFGYYTEQDERPSDDRMWEGFSQLDRIYEDVVADGVTGYADATQGDETVFKTGANTYSWLPGANNDKNLNYYELGITDEDVEWMKANAAPDLPGDNKPEHKPFKDPLWDSIME